MDNRLPHADRRGHGPRRSGEAIRARHEHAAHRRPTFRHRRWRLRHRARCRWRSGVAGRTGFSRRRCCRRCWRPPCSPWHHDRAAARGAGERCTAALDVLTLLGYAGVLSHVFLDFLNSYGVRLLMPFSDRWFYGDALYIVDPWMYLALGGGVCARLRSTTQRPVTARSVRRRPDSRSPASTWR